MKSYYEVVDENIDWTDQGIKPVVYESIFILSSFIPEVIVPHINPYY